MTSIKNLLIGVIFFTLIIFGGVSILNSFDSAGGGFISSDASVVDFNHTFNRIDDISAGVSNIKSDLGRGNETDGGGFLEDFGFLDSIIKTGYNSIKGFFGMFGFIEDILSGLTDTFGVPSWIVTLLILMLTTFIAFQIFSAIFQREI